MSLFLLPQPQLNSILFPRQETHKASTENMAPCAQNARLKDHIDSQIRKNRETLGQFRRENSRIYEFHTIASEILEKYKTIVTLRLNKLKKSIQIKIFFSQPEGTFCRVNNRNKFTHISKFLQFRNQKSHNKMITISLNLANGHLVAQLPLYYIFNEYLEASNAKAQSKIFRIYKEHFQQSLHILEKVIHESNQEMPFGLQEAPPRKKVWENIYRYEQMINISSHLNESYIETEEVIAQNDRLKAIDIAKAFKNKHPLPNWIIKNNNLFEECVFLNGCLPQNEKGYYLAHEELQFIRSLISMPVQPRNRNPCENNLVLNHIFVQNINSINFNKVNEGGFSEIFLTEIDYFYVYSSEGHEILYEETREKQNNLIHKYVIVKKQNQIQRNNRNSHEISILKQIKNGLSIFLPKYYIAVNKASSLTDAVVMDFIPFKNLREYLRSNYYSASLSTKLYLIFSITQSLRYIRDFRIVHLDLKPNNIMIFCNLLVKLIDFGESYHPDVCNQKHAPGFTIPYSPPQIYSNDEPYTSKSDVFSLGIIMYEIFYNMRPYEVFENTSQIDSTMKDYLNKWYFVSEEIEAFGDGQILRILNFIISKCLSPKAKERPELDWIALIVRQCLELSASA